MIVFLGVVGASKATVADVSDNTNQAIGMTYMEAAWGFGLVVGPALGGLLAEPVRQYPGTFSSGGKREIGIQTNILIGDFRRVS